LLLLARLPSRLTFPTTTAAEAAAAECQGGGTVMADDGNMSPVPSATPRYSPSDLVDFLACEHLAGLNRLVAEHRLERPAPSIEEQLVAQKGDAHELAYLEKLRAEGREVVSIERGVGYAGQRIAALATLDALRAGVDVVHGATFADDTFAGVADFLVRVPGASELGPWQYEVEDAKLARRTRAGTIVQLSAYSDALARIQGVAPQSMHAILGDGRRESFRCADFDAHYRNVVARFLARHGAQLAYPEPVEACGRCRWNERCEARRRNDDHVSLVAGVRRSQTLKLATAAVTTVAGLASAPDSARPRRLESRSFETIRAQARLQVEARETGRPVYKLLSFEKDRGFGLLPEPDAGDVYFDMEGDPFYDGGSLEYLFGAAYREDGRSEFTAFLGHDRAAEKKAFEDFVDWVAARRLRFPKLHVYHYATYEETALKRLASTHVTREAEVDTFLREGVLVDLFEVVRQSLRASFESYSLKKIEQFYRGERQAVVTSAMGSVVAYERYLETRDPDELGLIVAYNRDDCMSTLELHTWLLERKREAEESAREVIPWRPAIPPEPEKNDPELDGIAAQLASGVDDPVRATPDDRARWLAAQLLVYHRREAKPEWWAYFERMRRKTLEDLVEDLYSIGNLRPTGEPPQPLDRSLAHTFVFESQEHKLKLGGSVHDRLTGKGAGEIVALDDVSGRLTLKRGPSLRDVPLPLAVCAAGPINDDKQRDALLRFGRAYANDGARSRYRAARDLLRADSPRLAGLAPGEPIDDGDTAPEKLASLAARLDDSYLFVQGPPGSGKTYTGARAIVSLLEAGLRVGVSATSHKAIHNILAEIERAADERRFEFAGMKKSSAGRADSVYDSEFGFIDCSDSPADCLPSGRIRLVAGTAWLFANAQFDSSLDVLVIDEAGQVALADAIAMATSARNVILLGDPMQLAQVSQGHHPEFAGTSVLEHLLGENTATVTPNRGLFLPRTYRMHPEICRFVSELSYDGRLVSASGCAQQRVIPRAGATLFGGAGLRYLPVEHEGNLQSSPEEADAIVRAVDDFAGGTVIDARGSESVLEQHHILVVTPYNAQVKTLRERLNEAGLAGVRVGTVDKFQGQEAPVVFFSMASSRGDDLPRGLEFLFDRNRLNVAVSRARALAVLVCTPTLLDTHGSSVEQLRMLNAVCRFVESSAGLSLLPGRAPELANALGTGD